MPADTLNKVSPTVDRRDFAHLLLVHEDVFDQLSADGAAEHGPPQMRERALELATQQTSVRKSISRRLSGD